METRAEDTVSVTLKYRKIIRNVFFCLPAAFPNQRSHCHLHGVSPEQDTGLYNV